MALQTSINEKLAFGVAGAFFDNSPRRVIAKIGGGTVSAGVGKVVSYEDKDLKPEFVVPGGTAYAGIVVDAHQYISEGGLAPSMNVKVGTELDVCTFGHIIVDIADNGTASAGIGDGVEYSVTDGSLKVLIAGSTAADAGYAILEGAKVLLPKGGENGLAVLELNK